MKTQTYRGSRGHVETVSLFGHGGRRMLGRWYDKNVEQGRLSERGRLIRPEDQRRYPASGRPPTEAITGDFVRGCFRRRFVPLWKATEGVIVASVLRLADRLRELVEAGDLTPGQAKAIAGHLVLDSANAHLQAPSTVRRDRANARNHGLVLADGSLDEVDVDLHAVLEAALESRGGTPIQGVPLGGPAFQTSLGTSLMW